MRKTMLACLLLLSLAPMSAYAVLYTYEYAGNNFTDATGFYSTSDSVSATFTVDLPTNLNLPAGDYTAFVSDFSISDGLRTITDADGPFAELQIVFATDAVGEIDEWLFLAQFAVSNFIGTGNIDTTVVDSGRVSASDFGSVDGNPGTWRQVPVPAPATLALLGLGLLGVGYRRRRQ